eukprot:scaffold676_cov273-Pinguiococcus_pyrenoidosus.AAC.15
MFFIPVPGAVILIQLVVAALAVLLMSSLTDDKSQKIEFKWEAQRAYLIYVFFFVVSVYSNMMVRVLRMSLCTSCLGSMQSVEEEPPRSLLLLLFLLWALETSNVDTVIIFRSCAPLAVSICDFLFMGRELPSLRSAGVLFTLVGGAYFYSSQDERVKEEGYKAYFWCILYFCAICTEMTIGKQVTRMVKVSLSTSVFYTNAFSALPMLIISLSTGEDFNKFKVESSMAFVLLSLSCVIGTAIGYTAWHARGLVSATTFTLVGVCNKFLTIFINLLIWDKHANARGTAALFLCLIASSLYQQAPLRETKPAAETSIKAAPESA